MERFKSNRSILLFMIFSFVAVGILASCGKNGSELENKNAAYRFVSDSSLDKYIDKSLQDKVLENEPGANTPITFFVNDDYIGVLCIKGILIFDRQQGELNTVLDTKGLGFQQTQGDEALLERVDNTYLVFNKANEKKGYAYSFKENALSETDDISKINLSEDTYNEVKSDEYEKIVSNIGECVGAIKYKDSFVALKRDYDNVGNSQVYVLDEKFGEVIKFKIDGN